MHAAGTLVTLATLNGHDVTGGRLLTMPRTVTVYRKSQKPGFANHTKNLPGSSEMERIGGQRRGFCRCTVYGKLLFGRLRGGHNRIQKAFFGEIGLIFG